MKMKTIGTVIVGVILAVALSGCMIIKDTSGIKQYFEDQGRAEILAVKIKTRYPDKNSPTYKKAESLFDLAAGTGNGWMKGIITDAKAKQEVNISVQDYTKSKAREDIAAFLALEPALGPEIMTKAFDPVTATAIATFIWFVIDKLREQKNKRVETAIRAIEEEFSKARWTTFELTTPQWLDEKYKLPGYSK